MKILAFGEVMMRMMPSDYKTLTQVNELEFLFTGTGVNILSGLYQMGEDVSLLTRLPDNAVAKRPVLIFVSLVSMITILSMEIII